VALLLGLSNASWNGIALPLPLDALGMSNCSLLVSVELSLPSGISGTGTAAWSLPLPDNRFLLGGHVFTQLLMPDPGVNAAGLVTSRGVDVTLGW
jgi:hypothetical protein